MLAYLRCDEFFLVVAWCDLASLITINLCCHRFLQYDVPRYARCRYLTINSAYCCHPLMDSMKKLIVASSRLRMAELLSLHPGSTTDSRSIKKMLCCCVFVMIDMLSHAITSSPFWIWRKNTLVAVASCNTTSKIYFVFLANDNKIVRSLQYNLHWLALCDTPWYHLLTRCSLITIR